MGREIQETNYLKQIYKCWPIFIKRFEILFSFFLLSLLLIWNLKFAVIVCSYSLFFSFSLKKWNSLVLLMVTVRHFKVYIFLIGLPWCGDSSGKESSCSAGADWIPGWGRSPGEWNSYLYPVFLPGELQGHRSLVGSSIAYSLLSTI